MAQDRKLGDRWSEYRPTKALWFWSAAGAALATMIIGFTAGGWTTGGTAQQMSEKAAHDARAELASAMCIDKFAASASASTDFAKLKETSSYKRDDFIKDGGWVTFAGVDEPVPGAADLCADQLAAMDSLPARDVTAASSTTDS
jgi:hypothetical protein